MVIPPLLQRQHAGRGSRSEVEAAVPFWHPAQQRRRCFKPLFSEAAPQDNPSGDLPSHESFSSCRRRGAEAEAGAAAEAVVRFLHPTQRQMLGGVRLPAAALQPNAPAVHDLTREKTPSDSREEGWVSPDSALLQSVHRQACFVGKP